MRLRPPHPQLYELARPIADVGDKGTLAVLETDGTATVYLIEHKRLDRNTAQQMVLSGQLVPYRPRTGAPPTPQRRAALTLIRGGAQ